MWFVSVLMGLTHVNVALIYRRNQSVDMQKQLCTSILQDSWQRRIQNTVKYTEAVVQVFCRKGIPRNFAKFTGKRLCQSLFFNKVAGLKAAILLKKRLWHKCFPVNFAKFLRTPVFTEHLRWLPLFLPVKSR